MLYNGVIVASFAVDRTGTLVGQPKLSAPGLLDSDDPETAAVARDFRETLADLPAATRRDDALLTEAARTALRRAVGKRLKKRPQVDVHLLRI